MNNTQEKPRRKSISMSFAPEEFGIIERAADIHYFRPWEMAKKIFLQWSDETVYGEKPCWPPKFGRMSAGEKFTISLDGVILACEAGYEKRLGENLFALWRGDADDMPVRFYSAAMAGKPIIATTADGKAAQHAYYVFPIFEQATQEVVAFRVSFSQG